MAKFQTTTLLIFLLLNLTTRDFISIPGVRLASAASLPESDTSSTVENIVTDKIENDLNISGDKSPKAKLSDEVPSKQVSSGSIQETEKLETGTDEKVVNNKSNEDESKTVEDKKEDSNEDELSNRVEDQREVTDELEEQSREPTTGVIDEHHDDTQEADQEDKDKDEDETPKTKHGGTDHAKLLQHRDTKTNKVGFVLSGIHKLSEKVAYKKRKIDQNFDHIDKLHPEKMLKTLCPRSLGLCEKWVEKSFDKNSPTIHHIAHEVKERPEGTDPKAVFKHKIYEAGAGKIVENGYDKMADTGINIVAGKNPYLFPVITGIDLALQAQ